MTHSRLPYTFAIRLLPALCLLLLCAGECHATRTLNRAIHAAPIAAPVVIDGDLTEWNRAGAFLCCRDVETLQQTESATVLAMWDKDYLYLAVEWRDPTPLANPIDPVTLAGNGWRNDCLQLRFNTGGFITHLDCWHYAVEKKPAATLSYGSMRKNVKKPPVNRSLDPASYGFLQAFRLSPDNKGYTQEMRVPWAMISAQAPTNPTELKLRLGLELLWGGSGFDNFIKSRVSENLEEGYDQTDFFWIADDHWGPVILEPSPAFSLPEPAWRAALNRKEPQGAIPVTLDLAEDSYVSVAIDDASGNRVRCLAGGVLLPKGKQTLWWSGLDDRGRLLSPGEYRWNGVVRPALGLRYAMTFYQPNSKKPWNTGDGKGAWGPDHGKIEALAAAEDGRVFLGGTEAEAGNGLFAVDANGEKLWSVKNATINYLAYAGGTLYGYKVSGGWNALGLAQAGLMTFRAADGEWLSLIDQNGKPTRRLAVLAEAGDQVNGIAADTANLYFVLKDRNEVRWLDRLTLVEKGRAAVTNPTAIAADSSGVVVVAAEGLFQLETTNSSVRLVCALDLHAAHAATLAGGILSVSLAEPARQVWQFARQTDGGYQKTATIGKAGGRPDHGPYLPADGFVHPAALTADATGRLWVAEDSFHPKRVSVWSGGKWEKDYLGDTFYGGGGMINPLDPTQAVYADMTFRINLATGDWKLTRLGFETPANAADFGYEKSDFYDPADKRSLEGLTTTSRLIATNGHVYLCISRGYPSGGKKKTLRQIYRATEDGGWQLCGLVDTGGRQAWIDRNDDGLFAEREIQKIPPEVTDWGLGGYWGMSPSQEMDQFFSNKLLPGWRVPCLGFTTGGTPLYDYTKREPMSAECANGIGLRGGAYNSGCIGERGDYFDEMRRTDPATAGKARLYWFRGEKTGRWTHRFPAPGVVLYPFMAAGAADLPCGGEVICWISDFGQRYLFTSDMLYIGQLFQDARTDYVDWPDTARPGFEAARMAPGQETFNSSFVRTADGRYLLTAGFTGCRVFEVTGLNEMRRIAGAVHYPQAAQEKAREIMAWRQAQSGEKKKSLRIARLSAASAVPAISSEALAKLNLETWATVRIGSGSGDGATVRCAYDEQNMYVAWLVRDASPLINRADRWELAFKGGDAVDLMFRHPASANGAAAGKTLLPGDCRVLLTRQGDKTVVVVYRPVSATKSPYLFDAFEGAGRANAVHMDEVRRVDEEIVTTCATDSGGYEIRAAIPWTLLGGAAATGSRGAIDFGLLLGSPQGGAAIARRYWSNTDTQIVSDIPSEAKLEPGNWGEATYE